MDRTESDLTEEEKRDILTAILNSPKGKILSAMIEYSLRVAKSENKPQGQRWVDSIKKEFDKRLDRTSYPDLEFSATLGKYLYHFLVLDEDWVKSHINKIFPKDNEEHWQAAFTGYMLYARTIYKNIYFLLREKCHYDKAIDTEFVDRHAKEHCVQHIIVAFCQDWENLDEPESLINKLLKNQDVEKLSEAINFLWRTREELNAEQRNKVKPLWEAMFKQLSAKKDNPEYQDIIMQMSMFLAFTDSIDPEMLNWLKLSAKCASREYNMDYFIESLAEHAPDTPKYVAEIYLEILNSDVTPEYPPEKIKGLVEEIYKHDEKESADRICNIYLRRGIPLLRDLYEKYRKNGN